MHSALEDPDANRGTLVIFFLQKTQKPYDVWRQAAVKTIKVEKEAIKSRGEER